MLIQHAIFDLDGTLIDSMPTWRNLQVDAMEECLGHTFTAEQRALYIQYPYQDVIKMLPDSDKCDQNYVSSKTMERMTKIFHAGAIELKPGVKEYLTYLRDHGYKSALATATPRELFEPYLKIKGIYDLFDYTVTSEEVHVEKFDSPKIYETAMAALGGTKENTVVFEETYFTVRMAKSAGFYTVAMDDGSIQKATLDDILAHADRFIHSFKEMIEE